MTKTIYPYYVNSPETTLVDAISAYDVSFNVADGTKLPAAPNISNFGTGEDSETFRYTSLVGNLVSGVTRGFDISGNYGVAKPWGAGEVVARRWTAYDAEAISENAAGNAAGDVVGPASSTDNCIVAFDGVSGKAVKDSTINVSSISSKTTAAMSVYVDSAATGTGDGTSWTDAFTTIQAAINSLPTVLEHAVTIYVRKGASAYAENISVQQIVGKGSLTIRGEYYWYGECAAAATPSTTKFNLTATDGAQIAAGDPVMVRDGYVDYIYSTVKATVDKGSNVWEIELNNALPTGNIGTGDYYTIGKSQIVASSGIGLSVANTSALEISGLFIQSSSGSGIYISNGSGVTISGCFALASTTNPSIQVYGSGCRVNITKSYMYCSTTGRPLLINGAGGLVTVGNAITGALSDGNALVTGGNSTIGLQINGPSIVTILGAVIDVLAGHAITAQNMSSVYLATTTISPTGRTAATVGITVSQSYAQKTGTLVNNATTPESGSVAAFAYIGT